VQIDEKSVHLTALQDITACLAHAKSQSAHWVINLSLGAVGNISQFALQQDAIKQHVCDNDGILGELLDCPQIVCILY
jgi:hypothetical protein